MLYEKAFRLIGSVIYGMNIVVKDKFHFWMDIEPVKQSECNEVPENLYECVLPEVEDESGYYDKFISNATEAILQMTFQHLVIETLGMRINVKASMVETIVK